MWPIAKKVQLVESDRVTTWQVPDWDAQAALVRYLNDQADEEDGAVDEVKNAEEVEVKDTEEV